MDIKFAVMKVLEAEDGIALDNAAERDRLASAIASALRDRLDRIVQGHRDALKAAREEARYQEVLYLGARAELAELRAQLDEAGAVAEPPFPMTEVK